MSDEAGNAQGEGGEAGTQEGGGEQQSQDWRSGLPEDLAANAFIQDTPDLATLAKRAVDLHAHTGSSIRIPSEHASDEERAEFTAKLRSHAPNLIEADLSNPEAQREVQRRMGLPEEATGYTRPELEVPEGVNLDYGMADMLQPLAHEAGLTQGQFEHVYRKFSEQSIAQAQARQERHREGMGKLRQEWGYAYGEKLDGAKAVMQMAAEHLPEFSGKDIEELGPGTIKFLADIAHRLGPEGTGAVDGNEGDGTGRGATMTPQEAEAQRQEILRNREHPYWIASDPDHNRAVTEMRRLTMLALGPTGREDHRNIPVEVEVDEDAFEGFEGAV